ncbi:MAG: YegS/Rv2252/BmrU family lipid kinase [Cyclobacteriaceae bacterium]|nr:YegS/Rv2252/BmrU family lipid kinase [Cyclobacteriaceae bacterium]
MESRQILIIVNPASGKSAYEDKLRYLRQRIEEEGLHSKLYFTEFNNNGSLRSFLHAHPEINEIFIMGGDGTLNHVVNESNPGEYTLAIVSNGTGNDSVKSLHGILDFQKQVEIALHGKIAHFDLGICNTRYFVNGVGVGFDGEVVRQMYLKGNKQGNHLDYLFTVLKIVGGYKEKPISFTADGAQHNREILLFTVSNGTTFGGGFVINPFAKTNDGQLDVCLINTIAPWKRFWHLPKLKNGYHDRLKETEFFTASSITVAPSSQLVAHLDGEFIGHPPFTFSILKNGLKLRVPQ